MARLPEEIIGNIVSHLTQQQIDGTDDVSSGGSRSRSLTKYATISRSWQAPVEAKTFAQITLTPARVASPLAAQALSPSRVHRFVRSIKVIVVLPSYGVDARTRREDDDEKLANNKAFTDFVQKVFSLLSTPFPETEQLLDQGVSLTDYRPKIKLSIEAVCVSDGEDWKDRQYRYRIGTHGQDIFQARYESSYLDFNPEPGNTAWDEGKALPELPFILELEVHASSCEANRMSPGDRLFAPRALCLIASRMSGLQSINWELYTNEKRDFELRKTLRTGKLIVMLSQPYDLHWNSSLISLTEKIDFAKALEKLPSSLEGFNLVYSRQPPLNHSHQPPSLVDQADQHGDQLSVALRNLSQRLSYFTLIADIGNELFWPLETKQEGDNHQPQWPNMRRYIISAGLLTTSGEWRFKRPADYPDYSDEGSLDSMQSYEAEMAAPGDDMEDPFREELDRDAAGPLLLAAARATVCMPNLSNMSIMFDTGAGQESFEVDYWAKKREGEWSVELCVKSDPAYYPEEDALRAWREAAKSNAGVDLEVVITGRFA